MSQTAKHTPGPWFVGNQVIGSRSAFGFDRHIASMEWDDAQGVADAHLIAAAPELLDALECACIKLRRYRQQHGEMYIGGVAAEYEAVLVTADAAIAKATGQAVQS